MELSPTFKAALVAASTLIAASCDKNEKTPQTIQLDTSALVVETLDNSVAHDEPVILKLPISPEHLQVHPEIAVGFQSLVDTLGIGNTMGVSALHTDKNFKDTIKVIQKHTPSHDREPLSKLANLETLQIGGRSFKIIQSREEGSGLSAANILGKIGNKPITSNWTLYDISNDRPSIKNGNKPILQLRGKFVVKNGPTYTTNWELEEVISK